MLRAAGFEQVRIRGEELLANAYGWTIRTLEGSAEPDEVPDRWRRFAFRSYLALQGVDAALLEPRLPGLAVLQPRAEREAASSGLKN